LPSKKQCSMMGGEAASQQWWSIEEGIKYDTLASLGMNIVKAESLASQGREQYNLTGCKNQ
jgi:hypothetical protein